MKVKKKWMIVLSISAFCVLCLNIFFLFLYDVPTKRPGSIEPDISAEHHNEDNMLNWTVDSGGNTGKSEYDDVNTSDSAGKSEYDDVNPGDNTKNSKSDDVNTNDNAGNSESDDAKGSDINLNGNNVQAANELNTSALTDKNVSANTGIYVREIPIALPADMDTHLAEFRRKAKHLQQSYPRSFLIAMPTTEKTVALTFDDGPDSSSTLKIIEILNSYQVPGTFFFVGQQMDRHAEAVKAALAGGHTVANHSWSHIRPTDANTELLMEEVLKTQEALSEYGSEAKLFRPPYGLVNEDQMPALIQAGYKTIAWSIDSMDWYFDKPEEIVTCVTKNIHPGAIVLMHSSGGPSNRKATIEALPIIIEALQEQGYRFVSLS